MKKICSIVVMFCMIFTTALCSVVSADEMKVITHEKNIVITGRLDSAYAGKSVQVLLLDKDASPAHLSAGDIKYINEAVIPEDGKYSFRFKYNEFESENCKVYAKCGADDVTSSIVKATVATKDCYTYDLKIEDKLGVKTAYLTVDNPFSISSNATVILAFYDGGGRMLSCKQNDFAVTAPEEMLKISARAPGETKTARAFAFESTSSLIPLHKDVKLIETSESKEWNVLLIGNSYSVDSHRYVSAIAGNMGMKLNVHLLQKAGATIKEIWEHKQSAYFDYRINDAGQTGSINKQPENGGTGTWTIEEVVDTKNFDAIVLQNYWGSSEGVLHYKNSIYRTDCSPYYEYMAEWLKEKQPDAEIMINSVWSNEMGYNYSATLENAAKDAGFTGENATQKFIYDRFEQLNGQAALDIGQTITNSGDYIGVNGEAVRQFPVGYAIQLARSYVNSDAINQFLTNFADLSDVKDGDYLPLTDSDIGKLRLNRDGYHLSFAGRYLAGLVWTEVLTGKDVRECTYVPKPEFIRCGVQSGTTTTDIISVNFYPLTDDEAATLREIAHRAVENFYGSATRTLDSSPIPFE